jgi:hypothetical protein
MTSEYLAHRAAVRNRGTIYHENVDQYTLQICPVAVFINCLRYLGRIYQRHTINNITGTVWAVTIKKWGVNYLHGMCFRMSCLFVSSILF